MCVPSLPTPAPLRTARTATLLDFLVAFAVRRDPAAAAWPAEVEEKCAAACAVNLAEQAAALEQLSTRVAALAAAVATEEAAAKHGDRGIGRFVRSNIPFRLVRGLDLKGGVHFVLRVQTDDALKVETETAPLLVERCRAQDPDLVLLVPV